jgi:hypothetical protein
MDVNAHLRTIMAVFREKVACPRGKAFGWRFPGKQDELGRIALWREAGA